MDNKPVSLLIVTQTLVDIARKHGVEHFVYSSVDRHGFQPTEVPHFISKHHIEEHLMKSGLNYTYDGAVVFAYQFLAGY